MRDLEAWQQTCERAQEAGGQSHTAYALAANQMNLPGSSFKILISELLCGKASELLQG